MAKTQNRGICQCCGREQAVLASGHMSKHGYEIKSDGSEAWFAGVCPGQHYQPLQKSRVQTDLTIASIRKECIALDSKADAYEKCEIDPETIKTNRWDPKTRQAVVIAWAEGSVYQQQEARKSVVWNLHRRAEIGRSTADGLETLADKVYGTELRVVTMDDADAPPPVLVGDERMMNGRKVVATRVFAGKVSYTIGKGYTGSTSTRGWRNLPKPAVE